MKNSKESLLVFQNSVERANIRVTLVQELHGNVKDLESFVKKL
jgi:hypothetical protein